MPLLAMLTCLVLGGGASPAHAGELPDAAMINSANRVATFIERGASAPLAGTFVAGSVTIIENFPPFVFEGPDAVTRWSKQMRVHLLGVSSLRHSFGRARDFSRKGHTVYFSLPTKWRGLDHGKLFVESGGWAFVLTKQNRSWRVRSYAWSVIRSSEN